jgi:tetratricopeptide (TPR) repeat protein
MRRLSPYWIYYAATFFLAYAQRNPLFALLVLVFFVLRPWLPDPVAIARNLGRIGSLKRQADMNAANRIARRDLGMAYLELRRPRSALRYLDEAAARDPRDQEIAYLRGQALLRIGQPEQALKAFALAVGVDPERGEPLSSAPTNERSFRRFHEAFLGAATALEELERYDQAEEALQMAARTNSSALEPLVRLARVRKRRKDDRGRLEELTTP